MPDFVALGIDLAADPKNTGAATYSVVDGVGRIDVVADKATDDVLVGLALTAGVVGIDAPLGWPDDFVAAVNGHHVFAGWPDADDAVDQRRRLCKRETDRFVAAVTGLHPLSVSADLIASVAFRAARLQMLLGEPASRDGLGLIVETYPAAALKLWGLPHRGYKKAGGAELRSQIVEALAKKFNADGPWMETCRQSDHRLDAVICAVLAHMTKHGQTMGPPPESAELAKREGWIRLPKA